VRSDAPFEKTSQTSRFIDSGTVFAGPADVGDYLQKMREITKTLLADFQQKYLTCP
jgi:ribose transport system substrate-binding protein